MSFEKSLEEAIINAHAKRLFEYTENGQDDVYGCHHLSEEDRMNYLALLEIELEGIYDIIESCDDGSPSHDLEAINEVYDTVHTIIEYAKKRNMRASLVSQS